MSEAIAWSVLIAMYLIPTIVAAIRVHDRRSQILAFNVLLGWTIVGWVYALVIACLPIKPDAPPRLLWGWGPKFDEAKVCTRCFTKGMPTLEIPGSLMIEVIAWLCFLLPGLLYSTWRLTARHWACPSCGARELVPLDSPAAQRILRETAPPPTLAEAPSTPERRSHPKPPPAATKSAPKKWYEGS